LKASEITNEHSNGRYRTFFKLVSLDLQSKVRLEQIPNFSLPTSDFAPARVGEAGEFSDSFQTRYALDAFLIAVGPESQKSFAPLRVVVKRNHEKLRSASGIAP
jgi:hypothetical protein